MPDNSPILALPYIQPSQAQKHVTHNEALARLDVLVQLSVTGFDTVTPPVNPAEGETHALGANPTDAWAGQADALATWRDEAWHFIAPLAGWRAWGASAGELRVWDGTAWGRPTAEMDNLDGVGIGTTSDATNRLSVKADATLLSHDGTGHQLKINKAATGDTASVLFQSSWSGHAEMGLAGDTDFTIKVSDDGTSWTEALRFDNTSGKASGAAVQSGTTDATAGRLMKTGAFGLGDQQNAPQIADFGDNTASGFYRYLGGGAGATGNPDPAAHWGAVLAFIGDGQDQGFLATRTQLSGDVKVWVGARAAADTLPTWAEIYTPKSILGTVSQSGGIPAGAVFESGSNANGRYVRFADGTQICTRHFGSSATSHAWTYPAAFISSTSGRLALSAVPFSSSAALVSVDWTPSATGATFLNWDTAGAAVSTQIHVTAIGRWF